MNNEKEKVDWGHETATVLGRIKKVLLKIVTIFLNIVLTVTLIALLTAIIVGCTFAVYVNKHLDLHFDPSTIVSVNTDSTTRIYYMSYRTEDDRINRNGIPIEVEEQRLYSTDNSLAVSYKQLPKNLINAFVAIEDKRFFQHQGVDWVTTIQSFLKFTVGNGQGGGSTITQQLIKNITGEDSPTIQRKVEEIFRAMNLEKSKSKEEILEAYLNIVYLGNGCRGVQAAANYYFDKDVSDLTLVECAALASIVKNPSQYEPKYHEDDFVAIVNGEEVIRHGNAWRRWVVLDQMRENGMITKAECEAAQDESLNIVYAEEEEGIRSEGMTLYSWYTEAMLTQLRDDIMEVYGVDRTTAWNMLFFSGYKIYIPMDPEVQDVMEMVYENDAQYFPSVSSGLQPQSAMVICDPYTGDVLGVVGGRGEKTVNRGIDRATVSVRPPGSSIKPLSVYGPALDLGIITYGSVVDDTPVMFNQKSYGDYIQYTPYPYNYPNIYMGLTTINSAVTRSVNTIAMKVLQMLGVDYSFNFMKNELGFDSLIDSYTTSTGAVITDRGLAALGLGQPNYGVTVLEMTAAYCIFQNKGVYNSPNLYLYVEDASGNLVLGTRGNESILPASKKTNSIVISEESASIMTKLMENVVDIGTAAGMNLASYMDVAGKTGTTSADFDRYFMGYTPYYVGGVWTGYDIPQSLGAFGQSPSLVVWDKVMTILHQKYVDAAASGGEPLKKFELAPGVIEAEYCKDSGKLCTEACDLDPRGYRRERGYFTRDTVPTDSCQTHVICSRDASTNLMASDNCNPKDCIKVALIRVEDRSFPTEVYIQDAQFVYREMSKSVKPSGWWGVPFFVHLIKEGEFVGSSYVDTPYNAYCYKHCDYRPWGGNPPAEDSGYTPPGKETKDTKDTDNPVIDTEDTKDTVDTVDTEETVDTRDTKEIDPGTDTVETTDFPDTEDTGGSDTDEDTEPVEPVDSDTEEPADTENTDTDEPDTSDTEPENSDTDGTDEDWFD
ncbi:MAG: transglycosylase domain-containing protein [Clostridia bacterium]|nr:transglycosylase domain-containing protein [Clostridia bacterium]